MLNIAPSPSNVNVDMLLYGGIDYALADQPDGRVEAWVLGDGIDSLVLDFQPMPRGDGERVESQYGVIGTLRKEGDHMVFRSRPNGTRVNLGIATWAQARQAVLILFLDKPKSFSQE